MKKFAVIAAGGSGLRMGNHMPKQFIPLLGKPVLWHTLAAFLAAFDDMQIVLVLPEAHLRAGLQILHETSHPERIQTVQGGDTRFMSVKNGLKTIQSDSIVFVHDAVRCLITPHLIRRCYDEALQKGNAIPAIAAVDSIRIETLDGNQIIDRHKVRIIQTPQTFYSDILKAAFGQDYDDSFTDEANVVERFGVKINLVEGESTNIKITRPIDLIIAEQILQERGLDK